MKDLIDEQEIATNLALLHPDRMYELRALGHKSGTWSGYFSCPATGARAITEWVNKTNGSGQPINRCGGIYVTLNELHEGVYARCPERFQLATDTPTTADTDVIRRRWILFDVDAKRPAGVSSTDEELLLSRRIRDDLCDSLIPLWQGRMIKACSGNGSHLLIETLDDCDTESVKMVLNHAPRLLSAEIAPLLQFCDIDTAVFNAARITKLYGTFARKGWEVHGRRHRKSFIEAIRGF